MLVICQLVSKGAVFGNTVDANTLTSEFKEHKTNLKKAKLIEIILAILISLLKSQKVQPIAS